MAAVFYLYLYFFLETFSALQSVEPRSTKALMIHLDPIHVNSPIRKVSKSLIWDILSCFSISHHGVHLCPADTAVPLNTKTVVPRLDEHPSSCLMFGPDSIPEIQITNSH